MEKAIHIILILLLSFLFASSCAEEEEAPVLTEVYPVKNPTADTSPDYTFSTTKKGNIFHGGSCSSQNKLAEKGENTITFHTLSYGNYSDCTLIVTDSEGRKSNTLAVSSFLVDGSSPTVLSISPSDNQSEVPISGNISVTFSKEMDTTAITTNTIYQ